MKKKQIFLILLSMFLVGCSSQPNKPVDDSNSENIEINNENSNEENNETSNNEDKPEEENVALNKKEVFDSYRDFLINSKGKSQYNGYAEYGFYLSKPTVDEDNQTVEYIGTMADGYGQDERGPREFKLKYETEVINKYFKIVEKIENNDYMTENTKTLSSIIPDYIVIYNKMDNGTHWSQKFEFKGKIHEAKTRVVKFDGTTYELETIVNGIDGFKDNTYIEKRTYTKGKGLTSFRNTPYYEKNEPIPDDLLFGYTITE